MARFLDTRKAVSEIHDLIRNAGQTLILISPYLKLSKDFRDLLTYRNNKEKITTIIFREQALKIDELTFLEELRLVKLLSNESLHAKCYVNDEKMIISLADQITNQQQNHPEHYKFPDFSNHVPACQLFDLHRVRCQGPGQLEQAQCHPFAK